MPCAVCRHTAVVRRVHQPDHHHRDNEGDGDGDQGRDKDDEEEDDEFNPTWLVR